MIRRKRKTEAVDKTLDAMLRRRQAECFNKDGVAAWSEEPRHLGL